MSPRTTPPALVVAALLLLTACSSPAVEPPGLTAPPTTSSTPTPTPAPTNGIQVHSDPATGIVFQDEPTLTGDEAEVYNWVAIYQNAFWETLRTNEPSSVFTSNASTEVQETMQRIAANNAASGVTIGGTYTTWIRDIGISTDEQSGTTTALATVCDDFRQATYTVGEESFTSEEVGTHIPQRNRYELLRVGDDWYFNRVIADGTC